MNDPTNTADLLADLQRARDAADGDLKTLLRRACRHIDRLEERWRKVAHAAKPFIQEDEEGTSNNG